MQNIGRLHGKHLSRVFTAVAHLCGFHPPTGIAIWTRASYGPMDSVFSRSSLVRWESGRWRIRSKGFELLRVSARSTFLLLWKWSPWRLTTPSGRAQTALFAARAARPQRLVLLRLNSRAEHLAVSWRHFRRADAQSGVPTPASAKSGAGGTRFEVVRVGALPPPPLSETPCFRAAAGKSSGRRQGRCPRARAGTFRAAPAAPLCSAAWACAAQLSGN